MVAPMTRVSADLEGVPTLEMLDYYTAFAEGGFGGIITEGIYTDDHYSKSYPNQPGLVHLNQIRAWERITTNIRAHGAIAIAQLMHAGSISQALTKTKAPSEIIPLGNKLAHYGGGDGPFPIPEAMNERDISKVIKGFVGAARNAVAAGFHGIELHAANGYLLDQFLTPYLNLRTDAYGGSMANRFRIIGEIIKEIRNQVPKNFIVGLRISEGKVNNLAYRWEGGSKTAKALLYEIQNSPVDYLHVAAEHFGWEVECVYPDGSSLTSLAKDILGIPVIANGKMANLALSQKLLDTGQADLFAIGKEALSNPDFVYKVTHNAEITPFDSRQLYPNPSLFSDQKYREFLVAAADIHHGCVQD